MEEGKKEKKLLLACKVFSIILLTGLIIILGAYVNPFLLLKDILKKTSIFIISSAVLLYFIFTMVEYYYNQLLQNISYMKILHDAQIELNPTENLEDLAHKILNILNSLFEGRKTVLVFFDPRLKKFLKNSEFVLSHGTTSKNMPVAQQYKTYYPSSIPQQSRASIDEIVKLYELHKFPSMAVLPFSIQSQLAAVAAVATEKTDKKFFDTIKEPVEIFMKQISSLLENSMLHQEIALASVTDVLTNLYNKRFFQSKFNEELSRARRNLFSVSVMISDLDNFKYFVDKYGHPATDILLREISGVAKNSLRDIDTICRFGGDEFAYLLPYTDSRQAITVAERVREKISSHQINMGGDKTSITMSIGIATFPEHGDNEDEILKKADRALFGSKGSGRNKVSIYNDKQEYYEEKIKNSKENRRNQHKA